MLYLIGLGLEIEDLSIKAINALKNCEKVYVENYTTKLPYSLKELESFLAKLLKKKINLEEEASRELVESSVLLNEARKRNIALLIYGDPLAATTHSALLLEAKKKKIKVEIIHAPSIITAIAETGLQLYKFGKVVSLPKWKENYKPSSFYEIIKENLKCKAHTLLLVDRNLKLKEALQELLIASNKELEKKQILVVKLGKSRKILKGTLAELKKVKIEEPYCIVIPAQLHFLEKELLELKA